MSFKASVTENYLGGAKIDLKAWIFCANPWLFESENSVPLQLYKCQIFPFYIVCNMHQRQQRTGKFRLNKCPIYNMWTVVNSFLPFSALKGLLQRVLWKKTPLMTDFESSYKVLLFEKTYCVEIFDSMKAALWIPGIFYKDVYFRCFRSYHHCGF